MDINPPSRDRSLLPPLDSFDPFDEPEVIGDMDLERKTGPPLLFRIAPFGPDDEVLPGNL
jgi:hypothetical protein